MPSRDRTEEPSVDWACEYLTELTRRQPLHILMNPGLYRVLAARFGVFDVREEFYWRGVRVYRNDETPSITPIWKD